MATPTVRVGFLDPRLPDAEVSLPPDVVRVGGRSSFAVVTFGNVDLELNDSAAAFAPEYFATAGARVEDHLTLRSGHRVQLGRVSGRAATGHCFALELGGRRLLGGSPPSVPVATLLGWLADLTVTAGPGSLRVQPHHGRWSTARPPHAVLVLVLRSGERVLLDVRPAYRKARTAVAGVPVAGGRLSRSPPERPPYLTLDCPDHVVHLLTPTSDHLDEVADLGARVAVRASAG